MLGVCGAVFMVTVTLAAVLLPSMVDVYRNPTDQPDVVYARWQYLLLAVLGAGLLAVALSAVAAALLALVVAFTGRQPSGAAAQLSSRVTGWVLLCSSAAVWLAIWLGNSDPARRSWLELATGQVALAGIGFIIRWQVRRESRTPA